MRWITVLLFSVLLCPARAAVVEKDEVQIQGNYLRLLMTPADGGAISEFGLTATKSDVAAGDGMLLEGFGTDSGYVPNLRTNEKLEVLDEITDRPVLRYSYDCQGPNISGLRVTRTLELMKDEASVRVRWKIENRGKEELWVAPWVRSEVAPGGALDSADRVDLPSTEGIRKAARNAYAVAARNWIAATDPGKRETVYGVFDADQTFAFLPLRSEERKLCAFQTAFVPRSFKPGGVWETTYRVNIVRHLTRVDFATDELAAQLDYRPGTLELLLASVKPLMDLHMEASVATSDGQVWRLPAKKFSITPDSAVRCIYEWTAPADGAYEFLAKLTKGGQPFELGKDTRSPHGGIDTQFVVGAPASVAFEPWTDAPFALERGARALKRALAATGPVAIWFESPLEKIFPRDVPAPTGELQPTARIGLARNECESVQLVIRPPEETPLERVRLNISDLTHETGTSLIPASNIRTEFVSYSRVRIPTHFEGPTGDWPDLLAPEEAATLRGGVTRSVWITVYAPPGIPAGAYAGKIALLAEGQAPVELNLEATVYDFDLPATPNLKTDFGFSISAAREGCKRLGYSGAEKELKDRYLDNALRHRVTLRELCGLPSESANYAASLKEYEPRLKELLKRGAATISVPASLLSAPEQLKQAAAFVVKNNLKERVFCAFAEEPPPPSWPRLFENMQHWMDTAPDIPLMVTTFGMQPFLPEALPIWGVHAQMLDTSNGKPILDRVKEGREVWWYVNDAPPRPYGNFFVDFAAMEHRMLFWQTWALGIRGMHYWSINHADPDQDPNTAPLDATPANGNGFLVYPGPDGPRNSIRWETIRDGIEDYDYLTLLTARIRKLEAAGTHKDLLQRAAKVYNLEALIPNLVNFTRDIKTLEAKRRDIAAMIVELGRAMAGK